MSDFNETHIPAMLKAPLYKRMAFEGLMRGRGLTQAELDRMISLGIKPTSLCKPWSTQVDRVVFCDEHFKFANKRDARGEQVMTMGLIGDRGLSDIVAWHPSSGRLATRQGLGVALGEYLVKYHIDGDSPGLPVFRSPIDWFRADCCGIVIVHHCVAHELLGNVKVLLAEDKTHGLELRNMFLAGEPQPRILLNKQMNEPELVA